MNQIPFQKPKHLTSPAPTTIPAQKPPLPPTEPAHEKRLQSLADLRDKNLISPTEYEAKRQQILNDI